MTDPKVVRIPFLHIMQYPPDHDLIRGEWREKRGWETDPVHPPRDPVALLAFWQERANQITRELRETPLLALADSGLRLSDSVKKAGNI